MQPALWLLRHAQPLIAPGVCYGQLNVPAEPSATLQAAMRFGAVQPQGAVIRYSPLQRCEQLAQALQAPEALLAPDERLQEMHFGRWEGQAWDEIGRSAIEAWSKDLFHAAPSGGESLATLLQRVRSALHSSWQHDSQRGTRDVVWVTHAGVIRCVHWLLRYGAAQPSAQDWQLPAPAFGQWQAMPWAEHAAALQAL